MVDTKSLEKSLCNAERALRKLELFLSQEPYSEISRSAVIQAFEFTFEALWKLLQKWGAYEGVTVQSPKSALSFGFHRGVCLVEQLWLNMVRDRNLTVHTYDEALAEQIHRLIRSQYAAAMAATIMATRREIEGSIGNLGAQKKL
jgi:nucleotidyltransferase substrate binding protein (TIGR01987 family)